MVAAAAGSRRRRCICCAAAMYILLVLPVVVLASSAAAAADGSFITWDDLSIPPAAAVQGAVGGGVKAASRGAPTRDLDTIVVSQDGTGHSRTVQGAVGGGVKAASRGAPTRDLDTIVVSQDGTGHSRTVQGAVDMVPAGNRARVRILVRPGVYREKVTVPITKPFVSLIGMGSGRTVITWNARASDIDHRSGHQVGTFYSASVAVEADYFCASHITFENSAPAGAVGQQAVALRLSGDKTMLYRCRILGTQDTLFDNIGRHFLYNCDIQGSIDFIFGNARSLYQGCTLHAVATSYGAIAASQRSSAAEDSGFSFVGCRLTGSGMLYLGRAWGRYARVVYSYCDLSGIVVPQGWSDWGDRSRTKTVLFGEYSCKGPGASTRQRVPWSRSLTYDEARPFLGRSFINGEQWLRL